MGRKSIVSSSRSGADFPVELAKSLPRILGSFPGVENTHRQELQEVKGSSGWFQFVPRNSIETQVVVSISTKPSSHHPVPTIHPIEQWPCLNNPHRLWCVENHKSNQIKSSKDNNHPNTNNLNIWMGRKSMVKSNPISVGTLVARATHLWMRASSMQITIHPIIRRNDR